MTSQGRAKSGLRVLAAPFVVAPPKGVRIRTRVHFTCGEEAAVTRIGVFLGGQYRATLAERIALGTLPYKAQAQWRATCKQALTAVTSSRWAGAITRTAQDSYDLGMRGLGVHVDSLTAAVNTIGARLVAPIGGQTRDPNKPRARPVKGYASAAERFAKSRRKAQLEERLTDATQRREQGRPRIAAGGGRLWRNRQHLDLAQLTRQQWEHRWVGERMFLTADGECGKRFGNETIRVTSTGALEVKVPGALTGGLGRRLTITAPVSLSTHRDAQVRHVITRLIHSAVKHGCASISIENLGFTGARATGRETMGHGQRGKRFRRIVGGIPTAKFRTRLAGMAATARLSVIAVDPAYTSRWAKQHWLPALSASDPTVDGHQAAAVVIGRRSLGHRARRKPTGPIEHTPVPSTPFGRHSTRSESQRLTPAHSTGTVSLDVPEQTIAMHANGTYALDLRSVLPAEGWNAQISLLTGIAAARLMRAGGIGVLRTLPASDPRDVDRLRRAARALGIDWPTQVPYGDLLASLDSRVPQHAAFLNEATSLFRGAGYLAFVGAVPPGSEHAAIAAEYAHVTAPLRRLVDRFATEICLALSAGLGVDGVPHWVTDGFADLPKVMARSRHRAAAFERGGIDIVEAALLSGSVGATYQGVVVDIDSKDPRKGIVVIAEHAVRGVVVSDTDDLPLGEPVTVTLTKASIEERVVRFSYRK